MQALIITQTIFSVLLVIVILFLMRQRRIAKYEKRFSYFSLASVYTDKISISDSFWQDFRLLLKKISRKLPFLPFFEKWSSLYENYNILRQKEKINALEFLILKFLIAIYFLIFLVLIQILGKLNFQGYHYLIGFAFSFTLPNLFLLVLEYFWNQKLNKQGLCFILELNDAFKQNDSVKLAVANVLKRTNNNLLKASIEQLDNDLAYGLEIDKAFWRFYLQNHIPIFYKLYQYMKACYVIDGSYKTSLYYLKKNLFQKEALKQEYIAHFHFVKIICFGLFIIPFLLLVWLYFSFSDYFNIMYTHPLGILSIIFILLLYILYYLLLRFIMEDGKL